MVLYKDIHFEGSYGSEQVSTLFDSGASFSFIMTDVADNLDRIINLKDLMAVETATPGHEIYVDRQITLHFYMDGYHFWDDFFVVSELSEQAIIGASTMQKWKLKLDFDSEDVIIDPRINRFILK